MERSVLEYQRRISRRARAPRTHLHGSDVMGQCTKCGRQVFRDSVNVKVMTTMNVDGTRRRKHVRCHSLESR